jgi:hypothetical protein
MVDILGAVLTTGSTPWRPPAPRRWLNGVHSADVVLNILARRREPPPPLTITTPDALRLNCEPAADLRPL